MNISPIMSPPIGSTVPLVFPNGKRIQSANDPSSIVALSVAAKALYAASSVNSGTGNFSIAVSEAKTFADAFNGLLQYGYGLNGYYPSGLSPGSMLTEAFNAQQTNSGQTLMASLQSIGIQYQEPVAEDPAGTVTVDINKLQSAYNSDRAGTLSLLSEADKTIGQIAGGIAGNLALVPAQQGTIPSSESASVAQSVVGNAVQTLTSIALNAAGQANSLFAGITPLSTSQQLATLAASEQLSVAEQFAAAAQASTSNAFQATAAASVAIAAAPSAPQAATAEMTPATTSTGTSATTPQNLQAAAAGLSAGAAATPAAAQAIPNSIDPLLVATSPFTAQAIAAYHMVDGIFDTGKGRPYGHSGDPYGEYMPIEPPVSVREQLHR